MIYLEGHSYKSVTVTGLSCISTLSQDPLCSRRDLLLHTFDPYTSDSLLSRTTEAYKLLNSTTTTPNLRLYEVSCFDPGHPPLMVLHLKSGYNLVRLLTVTNSHFLRRTSSAFEGFTSQSLCPTH